MGVQEINIVDIVRPITKLAVMVRHAGEAIEMTQEAVKQAMTPRYGPCWLDIPGDVQSARI